MKTCKNCPKKTSSTSIIKGEKKMKITSLFQLRRGISKKTKI